MGLEYANDIACIKSAIYCCFQTAQKIFAAVNYRDKKPALQTTYVTYRFTLPGQAFEKWNHTKSVASTGGIKLHDLLRPFYHCQYVERDAYTFYAFWIHLFMICD